MNRLVSMILSLLVAFATVSIAQTNPTASAETKDTAFVPANNTQYYFPIEVFKDSSRRVGAATFINAWYSKHLFAMREPVFYGDRSDKEIYRFTWLRTFHNPIAIRIEKQGDAYMLYWKLCDGAGGYYPGQLTVDKQRIIDKATWDKFKKLLAQINYWHLQTGDITSGKDGAQWILEGKTGNQYHLVDRWTPDKKSDYYQCCNFLIELTDLKVKRGDKY